MGGTVDLRSRENEGTTIWFELSFLQGQNVEPFQLPTSLLEGRVLAAASLSENCDSLRQLLETSGFASIDLAADLAEAERLAATGSYGLVVLDGFREADCDRLQRLLDRATPRVFNLQPGEGPAVRPPLNRRTLARALMRAQPESASQEAGPQRQLRILVVEDNAISQTVMRLMLGEQGHSVELAGTGKQAVAMLEQRHYDLVLMDMQMPEMNGLEATGQIRARERQTGRPRTPIVALTARAQNSDRDACLSAGMDGYLTKPIHSSELSEILAEL